MYLRKNINLKYLLLCFNVFFVAINSMTENEKILCKKELLIKCTNIKGGTIEIPAPEKKFYRYTTIQSSLCENKLTPLEAKNYAKSIAYLFEQSKTIDIEEFAKCVKNYKQNKTIPPVEIIETAKNEDNSAVSIYFDYTNLIRPDQRQQEKKYLLPSKLMINLGVEMKNNGKMLSVEETMAFIHCLRSREDEVFDISLLEVGRNL